MAGNRQAKPTAADIRAAKELKRRWLAIPRDFRPTQEQMAARYGEGANQSLMSQYLNGRIPLNIRAVMFFAREFGCAPREIYPDLPGLDAFTDLYHTMTGRGFPEGVADPKMVYFAGHGAAPEDREWASFDAAKKRDILELLHKASSLSAPAEKAKKSKGKRRK
jgi:transcriptional regulator with XRE-family HTH domain